MAEKSISDSGRDRQILESASWFAVVHAYLECSRRYTRMMQQFDLTVTQLDVLAAIDYLGQNAVPKRIAERLVVTPANITGVLKRLGDQGLVSTHHNPDDRRSFACALTPKGKALYTRAAAAGQRFIRAQLAPFDDEQLRHTESMMRHMRSHLMTLDPHLLAEDISDLEDSPALSPTRQR